VTALLEIDALSVAYGDGTASIRVVRDVSLSLNAGEALGVVGESGSGKSQTMLALLRLLPSGGRVTARSLSFQGRQLLQLSAGEMRALRGRGIGLVQQDALSALNPAKTIFAQLSEPLRLFHGLDRRTARIRCEALLDMVGIPGARAKLDAYPHQLSGGMRQRVLIAMAISSEPLLLIADEPTTALDVTVQVQILQLLDRLRRELGMAMILISHDLGVVAGITDRVAVMYAGLVVETAPTERLFAQPRHPYTRALLEATPAMADEVESRLRCIPGLPPSPMRPVAGCPFSSRCGFVEPAACQRAMPASVSVAAAHSLRCHVDPWAISAGREEAGIDA
jgi:oligopeptide/dipeptide ABC transporter ATP-binding protein